jgi:Flp pilus assembly protein TadB
MRLAVASALVLWAGVTLLLSQLRWFNRRPLVQRLQPYTIIGGNGSSGIGSVDSFREVMTPLATHVGARVATAFGVDEDVATRLRRIHSTRDATTFRVHQVAWAAAAFVIAAVVGIAIGAPPAIVVFALVGAPLLVFLVIEQRLARESERWQESLFLELPVVAEQIGMLLSAGYSLGAALNRLAERGKGRSGRDLQRAAGRMRQGVSEVDAVAEWAEIAGVAELDRVAAILALNRDAGDVGRLVADEARTIRREVHRRRVASVERRAQQVWVPVTVATLVPGVIFLVIPFMEALRLFTA